MPATNRTTRRPATKRMPTSAEAGVIAPIVIDSSRPGRPDVLLFELDGEKYYMPGEVPAGVLLAAMDMQKAGSDEEQMVSAMLPLVETVLGERTMALVRSDARVSASNFMQIMRAAMSHIMDAAGELGKS